MYEVLDLHTRKTFGPYATLKTARRTADRKDLQYGAVRYIVRPVAVTKP